MDQDDSFDFLTEASIAEVESSPKRKKIDSSRKFSGAATYRSKFQLKWKTTWPCIAPVKKDLHSFRCTVCYKTLSCAHQGEKDVKRHMASTLHANNLKAAKSSSMLQYTSTDSHNKVSRAEIKVANAVVQHNIPIAVMDHLSPLLRDIFPDSEIAKSYASASTKTTCLINGSLAPYFKSQLVQAMRSQPFSIAIDGSNDSGLDKMNPMTVRIFDINEGIVVTRFLDMCLTNGRDSATAASIFMKMDEVFHENNLNWSNCIGISVDNTSVNLGKNNSILTRVKEKNPATYFMGCPCHILHNACMKAEEKFKKITNFDVEEMMIDIFYYFDKSTKRKNGLSEYCSFCDVEFRQVIKHVSTRWLSLELAVTRTLQQYPALKSYFLSEGDSSARVLRLAELFSNPMTEIYLMFYQAILQAFVQFNKFLQVGYPIIPVILSQFKNFLKKLLGRFISASAIQSTQDIASIDYMNASIQLPDSALFTGIMTRQLLLKSLEDGSVYSHQVNKFYKAVRDFFCTAVSYVLSNMPLNDEVLMNAEFADFERKETCTISQVIHFVTRYPNLLPFESATDFNKLEDEFICYQLMEKDEIPESVWQSAMVHDGETSHYRMDTIWSYLGTLKYADGSLKLKKLTEVAMLVLTLPHSNAEEERVFSMINKNKTKLRPNLKLDGTLSSILTIKLSKKQHCYKYEPPCEVLETAKKATTLYNQQHSNKSETAV